MVIKTTQTTHYVICVSRISLCGTMLTCTEAFPPCCSSEANPRADVSAEIQVEGDLLQPDWAGDGAWHGAWGEGNEEPATLLRPPTSPIPSALLADCALPEVNKTLFCSSLYAQCLPQSECVETCTELMDQGRGRRERAPGQQRTVLR